MSCGRLDILGIELFKVTNKEKRDRRGYDSRILDDESKQIFIQFELSRAKHIQNTLNKDLLKIGI